MRLTGLGSDLRFALRLVRADWRFSATLVATLAIGIAASGAIFNVVNATLLRPLPIPDETRVYRLQDYTVAGDGSRVRRSNRVLNFLAIRDESRAFSQVVGMRSLEWALVDGAAPVPVSIGFVSEGSFDTAGRAAAARAALHGRRGADRRGRQRAAAQPLAVAAAVRRPCRHRRPDGAAREPHGHGRRRAHARASASPTTSRRGCRNGSTPSPRRRSRCSRGWRRG